MRPGQKLDPSHRTENGAKPPHEVNEQVPLALSRLVVDCCQDRVQDRPSDMKQVLIRLDVVRQLLEKNASSWHPRKPEQARKPDIDATGSSAWPQQPASRMGNE